MRSSSGCGLSQTGFACVRHPCDARAYLRSSLKFNFAVMLQELTAGDPMVLAASRLAVEEVRKVLRRIHAAEDKSQKR